MTLYARSPEYNGHPCGEGDSDTAGGARPIAALLGHRKMEMTLIYARIANRVVADEYAAVSASIDALYGQPPELPRRLRDHRHGPPAPRSPRPDARQRHVHPPVELDCRMESACETCAYFRTGTEFLPIHTRQRDHGQNDRAELFTNIIHNVAQAP